MAYLTEPDSDTLFSMVLDESQPEALRRLPLTKCYLPRQIIVKAVAETYHKDFRKLWEQAKTGYAHWFYQESATQGQTPIEPIPTDVYLRITPEDRLFSLPPEALDTLTSATQVWLKDLRDRFEEVLRGLAPYADGLSFQRSMLETLSDIQVQKSLAEPQLHGLSAPCRRCFSPTLPEVSPTCIYCPAGAICTEK